LSINDVPRVVALKDVIVSCDDGVDLVPSAIEVAGTEAALLGRPAREYVLQQALDDVRADYDLICSTARRVWVSSPLNA
jgi:chromosome partitioning protein